MDIYYYNEILHPKIQTEDIFKPTAMKSVHDPIHF